MAQKSFKVNCDSSQPPLGVLLTVQYLRPECDASFEWGKKTFIEISCIGKCSTSITSATAISRYFARLFSEKQMYGKTILENTEVDHWLQFGLRNANNLQMNNCLNYLNQALTSSTYLVGHSITIADLEILGRLYCSSKFQEMLANNSVPQNALRWYNFLISQEHFVNVLKSLPKEVKTFQNARSSPKELFAAGDNASHKQQDKGKFVELPGAEMGKVVVRFPPEASGFLHIGHAKAALLNQHYQLEFQGKLIMRFDDTNPAKEKEDFEKVILDDVALLQIKYDMLSYTSDYFDVIMEKMEKLLSCGMAYVDDTPADEMKQEREQRIESKNRNNTVEKNLEMWEEMKKGTEIGQKQCVRAKLNMNSDNGCMRDPTFYRCKNEIHPRTGNKYKVYPTYDFACPIVDSIEGVTHALRTTEYHDRDEQYFWVLDTLGMFKPHIYEYSRLNMMNTVLSKRKLTWFVEQGIVDDWDDPRMPTVRGVLRRGMTVEGLKKFIIAQGSSRSVVLMEWDKIWAFNKKVIDNDAPRYTAVEKENSITVFVKDAKEDSIQVPKHPKNRALGEKIIVTSSKILIDYTDAEAMKEGENVTFINWGNLLINKIIKDSKGKIESIEASLNLENKDYKKTLKVTWLPITDSSSLIPCTCIYYDHIISKGVLNKDEDFKDFLGENTKTDLSMYGESVLQELKKGDIIQLQRKGYFICDHPYDHSTVKHIGRASSLILISIPDGSKDQAYVPKCVQNIKNKAESKKEKIQRSKGKIFEKSPQDTINCSQTFEALGKEEVDKSRLNEKIQQQGDKIRTLKVDKVSKEVLDPEIKMLLELKNQYKNLTGSEWKPENFKNTMQCQKSTTSDEIAKLDEKIKQQGNKVRSLKAEKAGKDVIDAEVKILLQLKTGYKSLTGSDWKPEDSKNKVHSQKEAESGDVKKLEDQIKEQGNKIRNLKAEKVNKQVLDPEIKMLLELKNQYKNLTGSDWKPENAKNTMQCQKSTTSDEITKLDEKIKQQGDKVRSLKAEKAGKDVIDTEVKILLQLKTSYKSLTGSDWKPEDSKNKVQCQKEVESGDVRKLEDQIKEQGNKIRNLKAEKVGKDVLDPEIKLLLQLKASYKNLTGSDWTPEAIKSKDAKSCSNEKNKSSKVNTCGDGTGCKKSVNDAEKNKQKSKGKEKSPPNVERTQETSGSGPKKVTRLGLEVRKEDNLADWYSQVITKAELIEYYDVSGCYILRPWAFSIWEAIKDFFDSKIKALGVQNCYFPIFVSSHALEKEKTHIADFAPEVAWVTKSGQSDLAEPIAIRPTSETVMYPSYAKWIKSHRDLPLKLNQWCNIVRWEFKHPQPFLRTREILWQEGHTAFALQSEALDEVNIILGLYADIYEKLLAIPVIRGRKTEKEKFAGGDITFTVEAFIPASGRAIQGGTSHHLGQNFSKMFEIVYEDPDRNEKKYVFQNSWGLTTRTIGVMVMLHGDNTGLVIPPRVALYQVVIVPCGITASLSEEGKNELINRCKELETVLTSAGIRVKGDYRDNYSPGWKFNHWELKGVPLRIELGPKDIKQDQFVVVRRDTGSKEIFKIATAINSIKDLLETVQQNLFNKAEAELKNHLKISHDWADFCSKLENKCIIEAPFCGEVECEDKIKKDSAKEAEETVEPGAPAMGAKSLCITFQQPGNIDSNMSCIHPECKNKPKFYTLFGRSY